MYIKYPNGLYGYDQARDSHFGKRSHKHWAYNIGKDIGVF